MILGQNDKVLCYNKVTSEILRQDVTYKVWLNYLKNHTVNNVTEIASATSDDFSGNVNVFKTLLH